MSNDMTVDTRITAPPIGLGPDKSICGRPVEWKDRVSLDQDFVAAARKAIAMPEFDIGLCQWSPEDPLVAEYEKFWNKQRVMLRKFLAFELGGDAEYVVHRRVDDGDGVMKGYVRVEPGEKS